MAIILPGLVLLVTYSYPRGAISWHTVDVSVRRGDFLIPVLILCVESVRRWWREVKMGTILWPFRIVATIGCGGAAVVCFAAMASAADSALTNAAGDSAINVTKWSLITGLVFGTLAVCIYKTKAEAKVKECSHE
jgi:hypothetical protein